MRLGGICLKPIVVGVSNRHLHLSQADLETLFGCGHQLTPIKELGQPGQYAADEQVTLVGPKGSIERVRVLGPVRSRSQVEVSMTDAYRLGIKPPVRESGDLAGSAPITIVGPCGQVELPEGAILAWRHIHMHTSDAAAFGLQDRDMVKVRFGGDRALVMENVIVRVRDDFALEMHIDTDEANAALAKNGQEVTILK
jgi:putative phosphotransacetylase